MFVLKWFQESWEPISDGLPVTSQGQSQSKLTDKMEASMKQIFSSPDFISKHAGRPILLPFYLQYFALIKT